MIHSGPFPIQIATCAPLTTPAQRQTGLQWVWTRDELRALLEGCGLQPRAEHASIAGEPWTEAAPSLLLLAERG